jgi:hypothetical protein
MIGREQLHSLNGEKAEHYGNPEGETTKRQDNRGGNPTANT